MVGRQIETGLADPFTKQHQAIVDAGIDFKALAAAIDDPLKLIDLLREAWQRLAATPGQRLEWISALGACGVTHASAEPKR
jgi:hypothetical protein